MLRLNPNDNQGIRYVLAGCLMKSGDTEALKTLLKQYEEDGSALWLYTRIAGLGGDDVLAGGGRADTLNGGDGNDTLFGGAGRDSINGDAGSDTINYTFGDGADTINGGSGSDTLNIIGTNANNTLSVVFDGAALTNFEDGSVISIETINADLLAGVDTLTYAGTAANISVDLFMGSASGFTSIAGIENVTGGSGHDTLRGDGNANILKGGSGNDTYYADSSDRINESSGGGTDSVFTDSNTFSLAANVENLTFNGAGDFAGNGNGLANIITGGSGNDTINAGGGNDIIIAGAGNDILNGGAGNDIFVFNPGFGHDTINGFDANPANGQDLLDISGLGITAATFASEMAITDLGSDTLVQIGDDSILLIGVTGTGPNTIGYHDFFLA